ncbi:MAG: GspE/PulE family protein [Patescibacteria group bacterium]|nr:GspE/PulE family protein [Patescibacteria group bacterium]
MAEKNQAELLKILFQQGKITQEKFQMIIEQAKKYHLNPDEFIETNGMVAEDDIIQAKSRLFNLPAINLRGRMIEKRVLNLLPRQLAENYKMVVFDQENNRIKVALISPTDFKAQEAIKFFAREKGLEPVFYVTTISSLNSALEQYSELTSEIEEVIGTARLKFEPMIKAGKSLVDIGLDEVTKVTPIAKLVSTILKYAVDTRASDIHIEPLKDRTVIRYRIDGILKEKISLPSYLHSAIVSRIKVMANLKIDETRLPQDGRIRVEVAGREIDLRISTLPLLNQEKIVIRILDPSQRIFSLEELGFWGKGLEIIKNNIYRPHGMFLVTGPTGCGKTTTLYALINILNKPEVNIVTLEDPVEYFIPHVNQSQINPAVGYTFASGLRSILRQDPNIIMVGEIRDNETAELAIHAALTGHIVLSTLHTNDAFGAIPRLIDMKVEPFLLASTLNVVISQRLVRKICENCKVVIEAPPALQKEIVNLLSPLADKSPEVKELISKKINIYKGKGCFQCNQEGYKGRSAIFEVLEVNDKIKEIIVSNRQISNIKKEFENQNTPYIYQDGWLKVLKGITTPEEVIKATRE